MRPMNSKKGHIFQLKDIARLLFAMFVISGILLAACSRCASSPTSYKNNTPVPETVSSTYGSDEDADAVRLPDKIKTDTFYVGKIGDKDIILRFNNIEKKKFEGEIYDVTACETVSPISFTGKAKRDKCILSFQGKRLIFKDFSISADERNINGSFQRDDKPLAFSFSLYTVPEFKTYRKLDRYRNEYFDVEVENDVKYGTASGYWVSKPDNSTNYAKIIASGLVNTLSKKDLDLKMDIYKPKGDYLGRRPVLLFIHGGGFYIGDKRDNPIVLWCKHFAKMGYVVASINYRIGFKATKESIERCGYRAAQDAHAAMRYLMHYKDILKIDPNYIFVAGSSAGGVTTLNLAFMRNANRPESSHSGLFLPDLGNIETSGNKFKETFHIRCVANMWGAVHDINMINNSNTSIISFHGNADQVVPYGTDVPFKDIKLGVSKIFFNKMYGSQPIHQRAKQLGYREELHTFNGCGHAPHVDENNKPTDKFYYIQEKMADFFYKEFVPEEPSIKHDGGQDYTANGGNFDKCYWRITGGFILSQNGSSVKVVWLKDAPCSKLEMSGCLLNGANVEAEYIYKR